MSNQILTTLSETQGPRHVYNKYLEHLKSIMGNNVISFVGGFIMIDRIDGEVWQGGPGLEVKLKSMQETVKYTVSVNSLDSIEKLFPSLFIPFNPGQYVN